MSSASSKDGSPLPLICLYGDGPGPAVKARLPAGVEVFATAETTAVAALRAAAARHPQRDVVLISHAARLPPHWWPRLLAARRAADSFDVLSPLSRPEAEIDALDARCWSASDRTLIPATSWSTALCLWRGPALARLDATSSDGALAFGVQAAQLDHLCVGADKDTIPLALAARIDALGAAKPPHYSLDGKPVVLHVLHGWGGGAQRFVQDLAAGDSERHHLVLIARGEPANRRYGEVLALYGDLDAAPLRRWPLAAPIATTAAQHAEYAARLGAIVHEFGVGAVLVSSLIGHSLDALRTGLPTAVVCHDYYPLWPRLHADFGDAAQDYSPAGIPAALAKVGADFEFNETRPSEWIALRAAYVAALEHANATLIAPSHSVQRNLARIEPALTARPWHRIEHGLAPWPASLPAIDTDPTRRALRIVVPGRLRAGKGEALIAALLPRMPEQVELVLLGGGAAAMRFFGRRSVHVRLDYTREELPALLASLKPDAALLPSTVAETYSYLLSELWSLRVPVIATRLGSFAERIDDGRTGLLIDPQAEALAALLTQLQTDRAPLDALRRSAAPTLPTLTETARAYRDVLPATAPPSPSPPSVNLDARATLSEAESIAQAAALSDAQTRLSSQQRELERRAEWAHTQERLATERTRWAEAANAQAQALDARNRELDEEVQARGVWAQSLMAETERLKELVVSEQRRLEDEVERQRAERNRILASASWRMTKPLRWLRRTLVALPTRVAFNTRRMASLRHRFLRSVKSRGVVGTVARIRQEFRPPQPLPQFVLPHAGDDTLPVLPQHERPRASVIVPVYNHFHHTRTCLQALAACGDTTSFEVIVVDDGSSDETAQRLPQVEGLRYVRNAQNLGFIGACNAGAAQARGEHLVFLNNDTAVQPGWLDALLRTFDEHPRVGLVGAKLVYPDGRLQEAGGIVFSDGSGWNYGRFQDPADPAYNYVREVDYCSGAAIAIGKELFERFGGFDAHYAPAYYEDTDLAMKVRQAGLRVLYQPASVVVHFEGVTSGTDVAGAGTKRYQAINHVKFLERWREALTSHPAAGTDIALARQHRAGKRVLIIDATTPQPDHDSGSLRLVNLMRVLIAEGHAVTFFADNRAWVERYTAELQQLGVEVLWHPWLSNPVQWFAQNGRRFELILISRHYIASSYVGLVRLHAPQARLVFDTVDLHYLREQREAELAGRADLAQAAAVTKAKELALIRSCDIALVVSPVEQELLSHDAPGARVDVLSNVHEVYGRRREFAQRRDLMFMGGYQHPPNIDAATWFVREIFPLVRERLPEVKFHLIGSKANDAVRALGEADGVEFQGYVPDVEPFLDGCRLALAPLRYGAGVKGKVNMSMSYGQPVVATPIAVEGMYAEAGRDVLVAESAADFADAIVRAYGDETLWNALSEHGLENVRRHFSFEAAREAVRRLLS